LYLHEVPDIDVAVCNVELRHVFWNQIIKLDINGNETVTKNKKTTIMIKKKGTVRFKWNSRTWVNYENEQMFCTIWPCAKFPGLSGGMACSFISWSIRSHDQSIKHLACVKYARLHDKLSSDSVAQTE